MKTDNSQKSTLRNILRRALPGGILAAGLAMMALAAPAQQPAPDDAAPLLEGGVLGEMSLSDIAADTVVAVIGEEKFDHSADTTAALAFIYAPVEILPTIDEMTRMDMIDYFEAGSDKPSRNVLGGECRVLSLDPDKIVFTTSPVSEYTLALLPAPGKGKERVIMLARTLKTPAADSSVRFYDKDWNELKGLFTVPTLDDWITPEGEKQRRDVENAVPFVLARLEYSPADGRLTFTNSLPDYIPQEVLELATGSIARTVTFKWNGKKFEKVK